MNERFLSRGKRKDNGAWVEEYYACQSNHSCIPSALKYQHFIFKDVFMDFNLGGLGEYEVIPGTVGQCTGLKDKNSKMIFEGDIVESRASENKEDWKRWVVTFSDGSFCFEREIPRKRKYKYEENLLCVDEIELYGLTVIGNIHDNPELLQRSDEK